VNGAGKRLLSKNAAFAPLAGSLRDTFPDARFLVCLRTPTETLPSQLSSVESGVRLFRVLDVAPDFRERLARQLSFYYANLERALDEVSDNRCAWVTMAGLNADLAKRLRAVYAQLGLGLEEGFGEYLALEAQQSRGYRSGHRYSLDQFQLSPETLGPALMEVYGRLAKRAPAPSQHAGPGTSTDPGAST
jgi:hypothetical protein